jgi:uncharacterized protein YndB with AHSA1/START domain
VNLDLSLEELLPHPVEEVWAALTDADAITDWLMATTDFKPAVGSRFRMKTQRLSTTGWVDAEVLELDPPHRMVWSWSANDGNRPTTVTFELAPMDATSTRLTLKHAGEIDPTVGRILRDGWPGRLAALAQVIAGKGMRRRTDDQEPSAGTGGH